MSNVRRKPARLRSVLDFLLRWIGKKPPQAPGDPYAYRMAPVHRGPKGRSGGAVADIEEDSYHSFPPRRQ